MAIDNLLHLEIIETMENYLVRNRPPEEIRDKLDLSYRIEDQSVIIFSIRPQFLNPDKKGEYDAAKATYIKAKKEWKVFLLRSDLKWHSYKPEPMVKTLAKFVKLVEEDKHHCFWG